MRLIKTSLMLVFFSLISLSVFAKATEVNVSPVGYWTTIDDKTKMPRAVVQLSLKHGVLEGRIVRVYREKRDHDFCIKCPPPLKNAPIVGLRFVWGLKRADKYAWSGGQILDPKEGKIYSCKMSIDATGKSLYVRGYIGLSLFGRTQTWVRRHGKSD